MSWLFLRELSGLGAPSLAVLICALFVVAITRGWIVPGRYHREVVADRDKEIAELRSESNTKSESLEVLTQTLLEKTATTEDVATKLLMAIHQALETGR